MTNDTGAGLVRPNVTESDAVLIARECYGLAVRATELGSNQDRNFLLVEDGGGRSVLRIDHPVFSDSAREGQHAALAAYRRAGVPVASVLPGRDGQLTQRWNGWAVRRSEFAPGEPMVALGYFAPSVLRSFGQLAAASVRALADLDHPGLDREHMWDMRVAAHEARSIAGSIDDQPLRERVVSAIDAAEAALAVVAHDLPVQAIHGDLTDDNVMGCRDADGRVYPRTVLDLGDLALGWRVAEPAVTLASLLHHDPTRPMRVLEAAESFHTDAPLTPQEIRALWPLVVLRAGLLVASGWHQLTIDGDNAYARDRVAGEQAIFDAATRVSLREGTELVCARLGVTSTHVAPETPVPQGRGAAPLASLVPGIGGPVEILDLGVESPLLDAGRWRESNSEDSLARAALSAGAAAVVLPYGQFRLTRARVDAEESGATWPVATEAWFPSGHEREITAPISGEVRRVEADRVILGSGDWDLHLVGIAPTVSPGAVVRAGAGIGSLREAADPRRLVVGVIRADAEGALDDPRGGSTCVIPDLVPAWQHLTHDPAGVLGLESRAERDTSGEELERRTRVFASAQERYYERPMQIQRGWRHYLVDSTGRAYIDMVNNVTGLGHGHPGVADAAARQIRLLGTNSRFLYRELAEYSERLLELLPHDSGLDTVLLVNSGSEAVDLALRLVQAATGRKTVIALREAYHGWTMASDAVTTSAYDNPHALENRPDWVHVADVPNPFRGTYRGAESGARYADDLAADLEALAADGRPVAGFICESVLGNAGGVMLPPGYLSRVYAEVRAAGGLCIADEVQVGFGRMGTSFWGFEQSGVRPDIITIAKPMGNGFPIGGVITSARIADALATQGQFFSSAGGNPVSCRVGIAVLDAMRDEGLQENARIVGGQLRRGFEALAKKHALIGPVHGEGLYLGVELVRDRATMEPASAEAAAICERLRELGVIVLTTSERSNVLKIKPPLTLSADSAEFVVAALDRVLTEGW